MKKAKLIATSLLWLLFVSCLTQKPYVPPGTDSISEDPDPQTLRYSFFLVGENYHMSGDRPGLGLLKAHLDKAGAKGIALWMGNNFTKSGLPDEKYPQKRSQAERALSEKLEILKDFDGKLVMIPGYNDWDAGGPNGYTNVLNEEEFVEEFLQKGNVFLPDNGCPGPVEITIADDLVLIVLSTQWWLHEWDKPREESECDLIEEDDFMVHLEDVLKRHADKKVILAGHHPMFSNGLHGGKFPAVNYWLPPVLGAVYVKYRQTLGNRKDLSNIRYRAMRRSFLKVCEEIPDLVYVSGLENSMQHHQQGSQHYIISGSLDNATGVAAGDSARFVYGHAGFGKINVFENGDLWLEFWSTENGGLMVYRQRLMNKKYQPADPQQFAQIDFTGQTASAVGNSKLQKDQKRPGLRGNNYRKEWTAPLANIPVFDIGKEQGGLTPVKRGGGMQTISLRMEASDGKEYVLRSIEKFPEKAVPKPLRGTIASDIVSDQVSASHPYAALAVPPMAHAVGVYHTNPKLVYVPDDPRLGIYREDFSDGLFIYEERPAGDWRDVASFGNSNDIISTLDVIDNLQDKKRHRVDQAQVVRSRLFDMVIGDWDRHDDQWRWASFKDSDDFTTYRPIPRDRDQAFFYGDGSLLKLSSHKWGNPKTQGFQEEIRDIEGLEFNARWFDRTFMTEPSWETWEEIVLDIQNKLTDEVIEKAMDALPPEISTISGQTIISKLKKRRDDLRLYARQYYEFISREVDVVGSKNQELFEVKRLPGGKTEVRVSSLDKDDEVKFERYNRVFDGEITREVRLFGGGGDDKFIINGESGATIKVRIMGGKGEDEIENLAVGSAASKIIYYDNSNKDNKIVGNVVNRTGPGNGGNNYNRKQFNYDQLLPLVLLSFNPDDGLYLGGGFILTKHGFRKDPFASKHSLTGRYAFKSGSFDFDYRGEFTDVLGAWDYLMSVEINQPSYSEFFYGFGNRSMSDEELRDDDSQYYRARYSQLRFTPALRGNFGNNEISLGGYWHSVELKKGDNDDDPNRFIVTYTDLVGRDDNSASPLLDVSRSYLGAFAGYTFDSRDNTFIPRRGFRFQVMGKTVSQIGDEKNSFQQLTSEASFYISTGGTFNTTLAVRAGGATNSGEFEFYQGNRLGGLNNLRGYRLYRFNGDQSFYQNTELRIKFLDFRTNLFPGQLGINLFHDLGRVWSDNPDRDLVDVTLDDWHMGYGGGLWVAPFGQVVIAGEYATSRDEGNKVIMIRLGFMF